MHGEGNLVSRELCVGDALPYIDPDIIAEMGEQEAAWYAVEVVPGQEGIATAHLIGRRFFIFVPEIRYLPKVILAGGERKLERGVKLGQKQKMLVGYVFVFTWLTDKNYHRLLATPGVSGMLSQSDTPFAFSEEQISHLRGLENLLNPIEVPENWRKRRKRKGFQRELTQEGSLEKSFSSVCRWINLGEGEWIDAVTALRVLDRRDTNQVIAKSLGLAL